ncbi:MAG: ABC transporter ATP-binding protein [Sulfitobacter sp.]
MISIKNLHISFENKKVLRGVNLEVPKGRSLVIIGGSGAGKSVLMRSMLGLVAPDRGEIAVDDGTALTRASRAAWLEKTGKLFQNAALFDSLPIWENIAFRLLRSTPRPKARAIAIEKLARVGLDADVADLLPAELSGGMRKRAGLARAITGSPAVLFFDEPTTGLDPINAARINALIRDIVTDMGVTAVTITHDMTSVRSIADDVAMLKSGRIIWQGDLPALARADQPDLRAFVDAGT